MIGNIKRKINEIQKQECEKEITRDEIENIIKKMYKHKAAGIDGIPAEFYQKFDFITDWLYGVFQEIIKRGEMTKTMKTAIVKILFKKKDRRRIENYRPLSLLCADYKILAKIMTERIKKVPTDVQNNKDS